MEKHWYLKLYFNKTRALDLYFGVGRVTPKKPAFACPI